tara:strand:- start:575 stop:760 length:186 start_codon:yes stop_codon:yes gene_type:complete
MENTNTHQSSTPMGQEKKESSYLTPTLMLLGVIAATLSIIVAGYFHGNMHLITTLKNAANP